MLLPKKLVVRGAIHNSSLSEENCYNMSDFSYRGVSKAGGCGNDDLSIASYQLTFVTYCFDVIKWNVVCCLCLCLGSVSLSNTTYHRKISWSADNQSCYTTNFVATDGTGSCRYDVLRRHQWRQCWHYQGPDSIYRCRLTSLGITIVEIRWS